MSPNIMAKREEKEKSFSGAAWQHNQPIYHAILTMPFNSELRNGTLRLDQFREYMIQDAHYLEGFARALSLASAKGHDAEDVVTFAQHAQVAIIVERSLHADYFERFEVSQAEFEQTEVSPVCAHYVAELLATAALKPFEVVVAALLPCFWIYREIGHQIHGTAVTPNPFQRWIDTYNAEDFDKSVDGMIALTDRLAVGASDHTIKEMHRAFRRATQLEWMFWDSAYHRARWPV